MSHTQNVLQFLRSKGASRFAEFLRNDYELDSYLNQATLILAPNDNVLQNLDPQADTRKVVANHTSVIPVNKNEFPTFVSRSGVEYGNGIADLNSLGVDASIKIGSTVIIVIRKLIPIVDYAIMRTWAMLPNDIFNKLVIDNNIKGKDLLSVCFSNSIINKKCDWRDQQLFRYLLRRDYDIDESITPRDMYTKVVMAKVYLLGENYNPDANGNHVNARLAEMRLPGYENPEVASVAASRSYMAILSPDGVVTAVGISYGNVAKTVQVPSMGNIIKIGFGKGGEGGTLRLLDSDGKLYHAYISRAMHRILPQVPTIAMNLPFKAKSFSDGISHAVFLDYDGQIWTMGNNRSGQLGHNLGDNDGTVIAMIPGFAGVKQAVAGKECTVILDAEGKVWIVGEIPGTPPTGLVDINPKLIEEFINVKQISAGYRQMGFIDETGQAYLIGGNNSGQLGIDMNAPIAPGSIIPGPTNVRAIHCGLNHTVMITNDNRILYAGIIRGVLPQGGKDGFVYIEGSENTLYATSSEAGIAILKYDQ